MEESHREGADGPPGGTGLAAARRMSHGEQLARHARLRPDAVAFQFGDERRSYAGLDERVTRLARALAGRGVRRGDRVAVLMQNRLELVEAYFAACRLGAIAVPVNFRLVADEVAHVLADADVTVLAVDPDLAPTAAAARASVPGLRAVLATGGAESTPGLGAEPYEDALAAADPSPLVVDVPEDDPAFLMYTSGTTGRPKGAVLTHHNLVSNSLNVALLQGIRDPDEVWLSGLPLFHIGGLNGILFHLLVGGRSIITRSGGFDAAGIVDLMERERVTGCYFVPTQWKEICELPGVRDRDLPLRRMSWGASVAPPSVLRAMADTFPGVPNYNMFGQTEMSSVTCVLRGEDAVRKMGSVGTPIINVEARIVDPEMRDVPQGEAGEIVYRGPTVMREYWRKPEATAEVFRGGWFHSGDLCRMDADGFITVVDRLKDMIVSGGENIYCAEVEAVLDGHPKVAEVAVIGVPHERWVETPCAVVVPVDPADPPTLEEITEHCRTRLASYKKPTSLRVLDALPRTASGKVQKFRLR